MGRPKQGGDLVRYRISPLSSVREQRRNFCDVAYFFFFFFFLNYCYSLSVCGSLKRRKKKL